MLRDQGPLIQCLLGTGFTWLVTAAGAALVFVFKTANQKLLDYSLGFGAGVMTAASFWSLLEPAFKIAGETTQISSTVNFCLIIAGFLLGGGFVHVADLLLPSITSHQMNSTVRSRLKPSLHTPIGDSPMEEVKELPAVHDARTRWHRLVLLMIAVTVHNFPEGLAVGVGFGSIPTSSNAAVAFNQARNLAVGIGIQNFPEGLAISLPLRSFGISPLKAFGYGQLSGLVEIAAGLLGVLFVQLAHCLLPLALSFAAGAMIFVVFNEIIPEISTQNRTMASWWMMGGFTVMMILDVAFS